MTGPAAHETAGDVKAVLGTPVEPASEQDYRRQIGKRVRLVRIGLDLSQDGVATKAGVTRNFVSAIERGAQGLDAWRLRLLADALGIAPAWLLGLPGEPAPDRPGERGRGER
jgi:transcriptional regulator with XRE-family HTH domain